MALIEAKLNLCDSVNEVADPARRDRSSVVAYMWKASTTAETFAVLREYEDFYNTRRPHRTLNQAAPLRPLPDGVTDLDHFRVRRCDRAGGVIHEYRLVA
jgi:hypothetical protein